MGKVQVKKSKVMHMEELLELLPESALMKPKEISIRKYVGMMNFKGDALEYQRKLRDDQEGE
jgi:hypothetical protein